MKYIKKPIVVEAIQWDGKGNTFNKIVEFVGRNLHVHEHGKARTIFERYELSIETLEGIMHVSEFDYIIKGISGEFYPCKPDIFKQTYKALKGGAEMSKEKQIEEMAKDIERTGMLESFSRCEVVAYDLYEDGYRKQSEGENIGTLHPPVDEFICSKCGIVLEG